MTRRERMDGLGGTRLAAYDDTLAAGPRGLALAELAPAHGHATVAWLVRAGWLIEYTPGRYRAATKEAVLSAPEAENAECRNGTGDSGNQARPKSEAPAQHAPVSTLRAPSACPQQPKKGQLALFGNFWP